MTVPYEKMEDIQNLLHECVVNTPVIKLPVGSNIGHYHSHPIWEMKITDKMEAILVAPRISHDITGPHILVGVAFAPHALRIGPFMIDISQNKYSAVLQSLFELYSKTPEGLDEFRLNLSRSIFILLEYFTTQMNNIPKATQGHSFYERAKFYINQNYWNCDLSISNVAEFAGCSTQYLNRLFKEKEQMSLKETLIRVRMERAYELLVSGEHFVSEVALMTGFRTQFYFSNVFRRYYGITPVAIRDRQDHLMFDM